jgi:hypothetical protein
MSAVRYWRSAVFLSSCQRATNVPGRIALPVVTLAPHLGDRAAAMPLVDRAERGTCFDRVELLRIAGQHDLRAGFSGMGERALHLARADHAGFVDHQHIARSEQFSPFAPLVFKAGNGA